MDGSVKTYFCEKCRKTLRETEFYTSNNLEKYPDGGKMHQCKQCITMHIDNFDPSTYLWLLEEADVPYVPEEWNKLMLKYARDGQKITGASIIGRYFSKMKLKQYRNYRWKDTEFLQNMADQKMRQAMERQGYSEAEIVSAIETGNVGIPDEMLEKLRADNEAQINEPPADYLNPHGFGPIDSTYDDLDNDLTDEDRTYLKLKWGQSYRPHEWIELEQLYEEMLNSYDIQAAGDLNTLKIACKCSLKANQLLDIGDVDGAQKATKMYDSLMKSGKWTAAQIKAEESELIDSIGELVAICEADGFSPKYYVSEPKDHVDRVIEDLKKYTTDLVTSEAGLSSMIEVALNQIQDENERIKAAAELGEEAEEDEEAKMFDYENNDVVSDTDFVDFQDFQDDLEDQDYDTLASLLKEEGGIK